MKVQMSGKPVDIEGPDSGMLAALISPVLAEFEAMEAKAGSPKDVAGSDATPTSQIEHGTLMGTLPVMQQLE